MDKAKQAGEMPIGEDGATLKDVLGAMLRLPPDAVRRVKKKVAKRNASKKKK